jgi:murein L,D-transpeptidase YafK
LRLLRRQNDLEILNPKSTDRKLVIKEPRIVIKKYLRRLELFDGERLVKVYTIVLGSAPDKDKEIEGDGRTPDGNFYVFTKNSRSKFHLSLGLSYPNIPAAERGLAAGIINREEYDSIVRAIKDGKMPPQKTRLGGEIYIHGGGVESDWTEGCIALNDSEIEELYAAVPLGCPVTISM